MADPAVIGAKAGFARPDGPAIAVLLTALVAFQALSTDMYLASLPALMEYFSTDVPTVQLTLSVFLIGSALGQLFYGPLSDRFGRRPVLCAGLSVYLASSIACALAPSIEILILARLAQAIGSCSGPVLGRAVVRDVHGPVAGARVLAYMSSAMAMAPVLAPIAGSYLQVAFGWRANFVVLAGFSLAVLMSVVIFLAETNRSRDPSALELRRLIANYGGLFADRRYVGFVAVLSCTYGSIFAFISGSSFVVIDLIGVDTSHFGYVFGGVVLGYVSGAFAAGRLGPRLGIERLVLAGALINTAAGAFGAALAWAGVVNLWAVAAPMTLVLFGNGLIFPTAIAGAIAPYPNKAGVASAMMGFVQLASAALFGTAVGYLADQSSRPMMTAVALVSAAGLAAFLLVVRPRFRA
ncbi:MAG: multidrug effflux MFS transporter [Proteobacteria bacterium]|nr:multidrug effflux MFS transporter [Pseudomonadota bacterium]